MGLQVHQRCLGMGDRIDLVRGQASHQPWVSATDKYILPLPPSASYRHADGKCGLLYE